MYSSIAILILDLLVLKHASSLETSVPCGCAWRLFSLAITILKFAESKFYYLLLKIFLFINHKFFKSKYSSCESTHGYICANFSNIKIAPVATSLKERQKGNKRKNTLTKSTANKNIFVSVQIYNLEVYLRPKMIRKSDISVVYQCKLTLHTAWLLFLLLLNSFKISLSPCKPIPHFRFGGLMTSSPR